MNIYPAKLSLAGRVALEDHKILSLRAAKANSNGLGVGGISALCAGDVVIVFAARFRSAVSI
jgi:hypothetical protein